MYSFIIYIWNFRQLRWLYVRTFLPRDNCNAKGSTAIVSCQSGPASAPKYNHFLLGTLWSVVKKFHRNIFITFGVIS